MDKPSEVVRCMGKAMAWVFFGVRVSEVELFPLVFSNKHSSLAIWSPMALPSPSEVCDYIGRSFPFFSVKQKEMSGLQEAFDISFLREGEGPSCLGVVVH